MTYIEILILAIAVAMDAFAVSISKGMSCTRVSFANQLRIGLCFGGFQIGMALAGYFLGFFLYDFISAIDHYIAVILLTYLGINMIISKAEDVDANFSWRELLPLAIATSIDALAIGVTLAALDVNMLIAGFPIFFITFITSFFGLKIGNIFGGFLRTSANVFGGLVLIVIGWKVFLEHFFS